MSAAELKQRMSEASPHLKSRITGIFYVVTLLTGGVVLLAQGRLGLGA